MNGPRESLIADLPETLTSEQAEQLRDALTRYHRQRVAPVSEVCEALREWARVMVESGYATDVGEMAGRAMMLLHKSNLAARLVYGGEKVRTEPCPKHKGRWSGCVWGDQACDHGCMFGSNVTGWLVEPHAFDPPPNDAHAEQVREAFKFDPTTRCRACGGIEGAAVHV